MRYDRLGGLKQSLGEVRHGGEVLLKRGRVDVEGGHHQGRCEQAVSHLEEGQEAA